MNIFYIVLFTLLLLGIPGTIIWFLILPLKKSTEKNIIFAITILISIVVVTLFIASAFVPSKIDRFIETEIAEVEHQINRISPEYTQQTLNAETIKNLIADSKQIRSYLNNNDDVNFIVRVIGVNAYISYLENFCENIDIYLNEFEETNTPFTLHNIFISLKEKSQTPVLQTIKIIEIIIIVVAFVAYLAILIWVMAIKKGWISNDGIVFGENQQPITYNIRTWW
ncbi:MAG: hypothetical protein ACI30H_02270 [Paludibacteraceae bacterium]